MPTTQLAPLPISASSFVAITLGNNSVPQIRRVNSVKNLPLQPMVASGVLGLQKTPAKTQEGVVINQLLYKEESWKTLPLVTNSFIWGSVLGAFLHPLIGLMGSTSKRQCMQTGQAWKLEGQQAEKKMLASAGVFLVWLGKNTPYVDTHNLKSWVLTALKGGFFGGLMCVGLAWGAIAKIKRGLHRIEADAQGNTNLLKTATWEHKLTSVLKQTNQTVNKTASLKLENTPKQAVEEEEKAYQQWRSQTFSRTDTLNTMLASGLLYSLVTLGLNALGSKLVFNQLTKTQWPWHQWFKNLETAINHPYHIGGNLANASKFHPFTDWLPGVEKAQFTGKSVLKKTNREFAKWVTLAFKRNRVTPAQPNPTQRLLSFLEESQGHFFFQLATARYHPVALLQLFITASIASALMTVSNKRLIKRTEQAVQQADLPLPTQLNLLTEADKHRIMRLKALKKAVSDTHFSQDMMMPLA